MPPVRTKKSTASKTAAKTSTAKKAPRSKKIAPAVEDTGDEEEGSAYETADDKEYAETMLAGILEKTSAQKKAEREKREKEFDQAMAQAEAAVEELISPNEEAMTKRAIANVLACVKKERAKEKEYIDMAENLRQDYLNFAGELLLVVHDRRVEVEKVEVIELEP